MEHRQTISAQQLSSIDRDILHLSHRWQAQRTICSGDTPGQPPHKALRSALAPIPPNVAAAVAAPAAANSFSIIMQRHQATKSLQQHSINTIQEQQQQQQRSLPFVLADSVAAALPSGCAYNKRQYDCGDAEPPASAAAASESPCLVVPACKGLTTCGSPSPYVLFPGRLSFAADAESARKFDCLPPSAPHGDQRNGNGGAGRKRRLLISPSADISAAFPTLVKPAAKQRRRSLGGAIPCWSGRHIEAATNADAEFLPSISAAGSQAPHLAGGSDRLAEAADCAPDRQLAAEASLAKYWSNPMPLLSMTAQHAGTHAGTIGIAIMDEDMLDTGASPASTCGAGTSNAACAMAACSVDSPVHVPPLSPLSGDMQQALPTIDNPDCSFPAIDVQTMRDLLVHGPAAFGLEGCAIVDCRYTYEYQGGHMPGAMHLTTPEEVAALLRQPPTGDGRTADEYWQHTALVFHCEFSSERGPRAAKWVRNKDRETHLLDYPALSYPNVFVLQGGYKAFWRAHPELCEGGYVPMDHPDHTEELKVCHSHAKKAWAKTTRTFALGKQQRRPSYCLRQSTGASSRGDGQLCIQSFSSLGAARSLADAHHAGYQPEIPPALLAAQHSLVPPQF